MRKPYMHASLPDFNTLKHMAERDPQGLEQLRQGKIQALIENAPESHRHRLRGLQFRIDMQRRLAKNSLQACLHISHMMHDSFLQLHNTLNQPAQGKALPNRTPTSAKIFHFPARR